MTYLDRSIDERAENFSCLFGVVEGAMSAGDNQRLAVALNAIVESAKSNPIGGDITVVKTAFNDPDHVWEL